MERTSWSPAALALTLAATVGSAAGASQECPYLDNSMAKRALGSEVELVVSDSDPALEGASSCRFRRVDGSASLVVAELALASVEGDPFAALRTHKPAVLVVPRATYSIALPAVAVRGSGFWFGELGVGSGVVAAWADEDGFQSAVALELPGAAAQTHLEVLTRVVGQMAGGR